MRRPRVAEHGRDEHRPAARSGLEDRDVLLRVGCPIEAAAVLPSAKVRSIGVGALDHVEGREDVAVRRRRPRRPSPTLAGPGHRRSVWMCTSDGSDDLVDERRERRSRDLGGEARSTAARTSRSVRGRGRCSSELQAATARNAAVIPAANSAIAPLRGPSRRCSRTRSGDSSGVGTSITSLMTALAPVRRAPRACSGRRSA